MPTSKKVQSAFLQTLPKHVDGTILELGSGWGTLAFPLAKQFPKSAVVAYESSWVPYLFCKIRHFFSPASNLHFIRQNFHSASFTRAGLVVCYLYPGAMLKLKGKFKQELQSTTIIATHTFSIPGWSPIYCTKAQDLYHTPIYHYRIP